jgi:hypothetical protein
MTNATAPAATAAPIATVSNAHISLDVRGGGKKSRFTITGTNLSKTTTTVGITGSPYTWTVKNKKVNAAGTVMEVEAERAGAASAIVPMDLPDLGTDQVTITVTNDTTVPPSTVTPVDVTYVNYD